MKNFSNKSAQKTGADTVNVETAVAATEVKKVEVETVIETGSAENIVETAGAETVVETAAAETIVETDGTELVVETVSAETIIETVSEETDIESPVENDTDEEKGIDFYLSEEVETAGTDSQSENKAEQVLKNTAAIDKYKLSDLRRSLENKTSTLEREKAKVTDWRTQAKHRDEKATEEYEKRKTELEELLKKNQERHDKRIAKTEKYWWQYCLNHEATKIKKLEDEVTLLQSELEKMSASVETKAIAA